MEIPPELKQLYNHWSEHTKIPPTHPQVKLDQKIVKQMLNLAFERMQIWEKKILGLPKPYTNDPILNTFRFCNIYRELDRQTIEFHTLLKPFTHDFDLWLLNMAFCRFVCKPDTIKKVGLLSFDLKNNREVMQRLQSLPSPKYGTAYIFPISTIMRSLYPTREKFFCLYLPEIIKACAQEITTFSKVGVADALVKIIPIFGFGLRFHWTEILIDVAYQYPMYTDLYKTIPVGPGSVPTMHKLNSKANPRDVCLSLPLVAYLTYNGRGVFLSAENWEGVGCEFRKYTNLKAGHGRRRIY